MKRRLTLLILIIWLIPALACNFPGFPTQAQELPLDSAKKTLTVQMQMTDDQITGTTTPIPGFPPPIVRSTATILSTAFPGSTPPAGEDNYTAQPGDTLQAVARRFKVEPELIRSHTTLNASGYLEPGAQMNIPVEQGNFPGTPALLPDSELIYSPTAVDFNLADFIQTTGGYLRDYSEIVDGQNLSGVEIIERVSRESSVNPRLLLAFLEFRSGWVFGQPKDKDSLAHPIGFYVPNRRGLYQELVMTATHLNLGYYGWRSGAFDFFKYADGTTSAVNPWLNPGSVGLQNLFAKFYKQNEWYEALYGPNNFARFFGETFGDPWERAKQVEPFFTPGMSQPTLELPFRPGERWSLTGGPHFSWNTGSPRGALDFAPVTGEPACWTSRAWVTASAPGQIVRSSNEVVALDLDGDGFEQTGWVIVYLHIAGTDRIPSGAWVDKDDPLGHPSCERGSSTGTHVHIARKYNGEWMAADAPIPFILSGWQVEAGERNYSGVLKKGDQVVTANPGGPRTSIIVR